MNTSVPVVIRRTIVTATILCLAGCAAMHFGERSAYVLIRKASGPAASVSPGPDEQAIEKLVSRRHYRYTQDEQAAWLIYVDERATDGTQRAPEYVIGDVVRNPLSKYPDDSPINPSNPHRQHPSLSMLKTYEDAEQSRHTRTP